LSSRQRCVWSGIVMMEDLFIESILVTFFESIASIALVVDNRDQNQLFYLAVATHSGCASNSIRQHYLLWRQSELCDRLWCLVSIFLNIIVILSIFHPLSIFLKMAILFRFSSILQIEIQFIKFFSAKSCQISSFFVYPYTNTSKWFYDQCLAPMS